MECIIMASPKTTNPNPPFSTLSDDLLLEIFLRLPTARSAARCAAVCRRWRALIAAPSRHFIRRFTLRNPSSLYTALLFFSDRSDSFQLLSDGPSDDKPLLSRSHLGFLPGDWPHAPASASFSDLLLLCHDGASRYCLCNPLTRRWLVLPPALAPAPSSRGIGHGLAGESGGYRAVRVEAVGDDEHEHELRVTIFSSETGNWRQTTISASSSSSASSRLRLSDLAGGLATSDGVLHFPLKSGDPRDHLTGSILALEIGGAERGTLISQPDGFAIVDGGAPCFGVVGGKLRLAQTCSWGFGLNIWELNYDAVNGGSRSARWVSVYGGALTKVWKEMFVACFDPNNGGVVFLGSLCGGVYKYSIEEEECERVGEIPPRPRGSLKYFKESYLSSVTLVHPPWPTPIPKLS